MFSLTKKVAIVTGGASGIGLAIARQFIAAGALVLIADRRSDGGSIAKATGAEFCRTDVAHETQIATMFDAARQKFGHADILVNNAGIQPLGVGFAALTGELLHRTFDVNVNGVAFGIKHAARSLSEGGRIINIASFVGLLATPGGAVYSTSKAAVLHLTKLGAIEVAPRRITVNAISPGTIRTPAVTEIPNNPEISFIEGRAPLKRLGEPHEVATLCQFLASDEAAYITGQNIVIDGGLTAGWTEYELVPPPNVQMEGGSMMCDAPQISRSSRGESVQFSFENDEKPHGSAGTREFRDGDDFPLMVALPAGEFIMGENKGDKFANDTERPARRVRIVSGFALGKFPVTVRQFLKFRAAESSFDVRCSMLDVECSRTEGHNLPIIRVSWHEAAAYCEWLIAQTGRSFRLPTEAEWEYACRAGTSGPFFFGEDIFVTDANFLYDENGMRIGPGNRTSVGNYARNAFGLYDMHGNVCEWVADTWHPDYNGAPTDGTARIEPDNSQRVIRGGAWDYLPRLLRSSWRDWRFASHRADNIGFRIATSDLRNLKEV